MMVMIAAAEGGITAASACRSEVIMSKPKVKPIRADQIKNGDWIFVPVRGGGLSKKPWYVAAARRQRCLGLIEIFVLHGERYDRAAQRIAAYEDKQFFKVI